MQSKDQNAKSPLISVIIPVYNVVDYLRECIDSIVCQSYKNLQIILVDDGSTDGSGAICDEYARYDQRMLVIHQNNLGLVCARKTGLKKATGEYIGFVDGDDYVDCTMYEKLYCAIASSEAEFVHSGYYEGDLKRLPFEDGDVDFSDNRLCYLRDAIFGANAYISPSIWSKLFKERFIRKCYEKVPDRNSFGEDLINLCACILKANRLSLVRKALYHYRVRNDSLTHRDIVTMTRNQVYLYDALCHLFHEYNVLNEMEDSLREYLRRNLLFFFQRETRDNYPISTYRFPEIEKIKGKKIVLYGAGSVGKSFYTQISRYQSCSIVAWVDKNIPPPPDSDISIDSPDVISKLEYDIVLVALKNEIEAIRVKQSLSSQGIDICKILWSAPEYLF